VRKTWDFARLGLRLRQQDLRELSRVGIFVESPVTLAHQHLARRYVIRGVESGGAISTLGRYVTFAGEECQPIEYLHPMDAVGVNGVHAVVVAPVLVRIDMFRSKRSYRLLVTSHRAGQSENGRRPTLQSKVLFYGAEGFLELELWGRDRDRAGLAAPQFYTRGGELLDLPQPLLRAVQAATRGATCVPCSHSHFLVCPGLSRSPRWRVGLCPQQGAEPKEAAFALMNFREQGGFKRTF